MSLTDEEIVHLINLSDAEYERVTGIVIPDGDVSNDEFDGSSEADEIENLECEINMMEAVDHFDVEVTPHAVDHVSKQVILTL